MLVILDSKELEDWAEKLLVPRLVGTLNDSDGEKRSSHLGALPSNLIGFRKGLKLLLEVISQVLSRQRAHPSGLKHRVSKWNFR